jgi:hypothetical protein
MERTVKKHCFIQGMNKEEVERALGTPTTKNSGPSDSWTYQAPTGKCLKYGGDTCMERDTRRLFFSVPEGMYRLGWAAEP